MVDPGGLESIKFLVATKNYTYGEEVNYYLECTFFSEEDIECCISNGHVSKTMKDKFKQSVGNKVYVILGKDTHGYDFYTQGKIMLSEDGKTYFLISAHHCSKGGYHE